MNDKEILNAKKLSLAEYIENFGKELELTETQSAQIKQSYEAVGNHLSESDALADYQPRIFPQGSVALGTTVRPIAEDQDFDVDLVCKLELASAGDEQNNIHRISGEALRENARYAQMLKKLKRGWRLEYADPSRFHLDITPAVPQNYSPALYVPDKKLETWKASNPEGYIEWFQRHSSLKPRFSQRLMVLANKRTLTNEQVDPVPEPLRLKNVLQRLIQILKRHRDIMFINNAEDAPISIIITTLAAKAYGIAIQEAEYENEFDLLCTVIKKMPSFIQNKYTLNGFSHYFIPNETVEEENFAEKWNTRDGSKLADAFYHWQHTALSFFNELLKLEGMDTYKRAFSNSLGTTTTNTVLGKIERIISTQRTQRRLAYSPAIGLGTLGTSVRANTFYGS